MSRGLLLFDIDGTLLRSRGQGLRAMHAAFQEVFRRPPQAARIEPHGKTDPMLFDEMARAYGLDLDHLDGQRAVLQSLYVARLQEFLAQPGSVEVKPGVPSLLQTLGNRTDVDLGLVTGNLEPVAWAKLRAAGLAGFFRGGAFGSDGRERSTLVELAIRRLASGRAGAEGSRRVWVIGDTPADVASGQALGTRTLAVATGVHDVETLRACGADVVLEDFRDLRNAVDVLCDSR
jgi:phosphoglycolate phosphatase-like HAD superfamily hydrolase